MKRKERNIIRKSVLNTSEAYLFAVYRKFHC